MPYKLVIKALAQLVRAKRAGRGLREVAQELGGVSAATLSRVENEKIPDLAVFLQLCDWLQVSPAQLLQPPASAAAVVAEEPLTTIAYLLRSDPALDPTTANVLATMVEASYQALRRPVEGKA